MYYLKNRSDDCYLFSDSSQEAIGFSEFSATHNYQWILQGNDASFQLVFGSGSGYGLSIDDTLSGSTYGVILSSSTSAASISLISHHNGTYAITKTIGEAVYALTAVSNIVQWKVYNSENQAQQWFFESCCFQNGDINTDGQINAQDSTMLFEVVNSTIILNDRQMAFADVTGDGIINLADATRLFYYINGISTIL